MTRRVDEHVVRLAAATLPRSVRAARREEWLADLEHAHELGIPRSQIARAAVTSALTGRPAVAPRTRLAIGATIVAGLFGLTPVVAVAAYTFDNVRGVVTTETDADGREHTVHWREYPGVASLDPDEILAAPSLEQGIADGEAMVAEIRDALTAEFGLAWAAPHPAEPTVHPTENGYGGWSMLRVVNAPTHQSTTVPRTWAEKERAIEIIGEVTARHGFSAPRLDQHTWPHTEADLLEIYGGTTLETQVLVSGSVFGPSGQWLFFSIQDLANDTDGTFAERLADYEDNGWQQNTVSFGFGANALLPDADRAEFLERLAPFDGYLRPEPQVS